MYTFKKLKLEFCVMSQKARLPISQRKIKHDLPLCTGDGVIGNLNSGLLIKTQTLFGPRDAIKK